MTEGTKLKRMTAHEVAHIVLHREQLFILDVRNTADYEDWRIEGKQITSVNLPYFELLEGVEEAMKLLPPEAERVLVVCAKEGSSVFVAEQLLEAGITGVHYLEGGMKAWSEQLEPVELGPLASGGTLYQFIRVGKGCLSYMVVSGDQAAVIDPIRTTEVYEAFARSRNVQIKHVIDTHLHADHISGGRKLADETGATYWLPPKDAQEVQFGYEPLEDGTVITVGGADIHIQALYSPGHTIGSTSFIVDGRYLLTGDILFIESIGRPDLAGLAEDWVGDLRTTLYERYKELAADLLVCPAHFGSITEIGEGGKVCARLQDLYTRNPGLKMTDEAAFRQAVTSNLPQQPNAYQEIRHTNMGAMTPAVEEQREMEIGPNRCAVHDR